MRSERRADGGMVTAEMAACLPVLVLVLAIAVSAVLVASARVRAQDAAREAARAVARGDRSAVGGLVRRAAPGAQAAVSRAGDSVVAVVRLRVRPLGGLMPALTVTERAVAAREPDGATGTPP